MLYKILFIYYDTEFYKYELNFKSKQNKCCGFIFFTLYIAVQGMNGKTKVGKKMHKNRFVVVDDDG